MDKNEHDQKRQLAMLMVYRVGKRMNPSGYEVRWSSDKTKLYLISGGKLVVIADPVTKFCYAV